MAWLKTDTQGWVNLDTVEQLTTVLANGKYGVTAETSAGHSYTVRSAVYTTEDDANAAIETMLSSGDVRTWT